MTVDEPEYPSGYKMIEGYYTMWNPNFNKVTICKASSEKVAMEIAQFHYGERGTYYFIEQSAGSTHLLYEIERLKNSGVLNGYISELNGCVVEYKTRAEIIDEVLTQLNY